MHAEHGHVERVVIVHECLPCHPVLQVPQVDIVGQLLVGSQRRPVVALQQLQDISLQLLGLAHIAIRDIRQPVIPQPVRSRQRQRGEHLGIAQHQRLVRLVSEGIEIQPDQVSRQLIWNRQLAYWLSGLGGGARLRLKGWRRYSLFPRPFGSAVTGARPHPVARIKISPILHRNLCFFMPASKVARMGSGCRSNVTGIFPPDRQASTT